MVFSGWICQCCVSIYCPSKTNHGFSVHQCPQQNNLQGLHFNTNIQRGDASQVFYSTLYTSKSTQDEDSENQIRIRCAIIKRIKRVMNNNHKGTPNFGEGLSRVLSGLNSATTRNVISATMAHLIPCNDGLRFVFSHTFSDLLVGQI